MIPAFAPAKVVFYCNYSVSFSRFLRFSRIEKPSRCFNLRTDKRYVFEENVSQRQVLYASNWSCFNNSYIKLLAISNVNFNLFHKNGIPSILPTGYAPFLSIPLREKSPHSRLFWSVFSRIWTEYRKILRISPYSVRMRENTDRNKSKYGSFLRSVYLTS